MPSAPEDIDAAAAGVVVACGASRLIVVGIAIESDCASEGVLGDCTGSVFTGTVFARAELMASASGAPGDVGFAGTVSICLGVSSVLITELEAS